MSKLIVNESTGCWEWTAAKQKGYGVIRWGPESKLARAHRVSYEAYNGTIGAGLVIDHLCRNPCCVNPEHLEAVTHRENCARGVAGERTRERAARQTHCINGHERNEANSYIPKPGRRSCRVCNLAAVKRYQERLTNVASD